MEVWEIGIYMNTKKVMVTEITRAVPRPKKWRFKFLNAEEKTLLISFVGTLHFFLWKTSLNSG